MINKKKLLSIITTKTLLIAFIFVGVGTIIVGGGLLIGEQSIQIKPATLIESFKDCDKFKGTEKKDCYLNLAKENKDESFCEKISTIEFRSMCYTDLAILKNDPELCGKATASLASSCREYFTKDEKLTIIYPNEDTVWQAGETYQIRWMPIDPEEKVVARLYKVPIRSLNLKWEPSYSILNTGSYSFTVFEELEAGTYQFVIMENSRTSRSNEFSIIQKVTNKYEIADWKIYQSVKWGYKISYPATLYTKGDEVQKYPGQEGAQDLIISDIENMGIQDIMPEEKIHIDIYTTPSKEKSLDQFVDEYKIGGEIYNKETIILGKDKAVRFVKKDEFEGGTLYILAKKGYFIYVVRGTNTKNNDPLTDDDYKQMQKIMETFRFIEN